MATFNLFIITQFLDNNGAPLAGGLISTFAAGTLTPLAAYTDSTGVTPLSNPAVCDSAGRVQIWLSAASYKFVIKTSAGVTLQTIDGYNPTNVATTVSSLTSTGDLTLQQPTAATSGANQSSGNVKIQGSYWDGANPQIDQWNIQDILGAGANPTSTLTVTHSGSSGTSAINIPAQPLRVGDGIAAAPSLAFVNETNTGWFRQAAGVIGAVILGTCRWLITATGELFGSGGIIAWSSNADPTAAGPDTGISRSAPGVLNVGNGSAGDKSGTVNATAFAFGSVPAQSGLLRGANNSALVTARNAANNADVNAVIVDASNVTQLGGAAGVGAAIINQQAATAFVIKDNQGGTRYSIPSGGITQSTLNNTTLQGAGNSNSVTLLNSQDALGNITGNGTDQTVYTFPIPANTIGAGKGIRVRWTVTSNNGVVVTFKLILGTSTLVTFASAASANNTNAQYEVMNKSGVQNAQQTTGWILDALAVGSNQGLVTSAENLANALTIKLTANEANPNTITPQKWIVELIQ